MAKRTKEQNAAIYRRRDERAKARGTTYAEEKRAQDKARAKAKAVAAFEDLGLTKPRAEYIADRMSLREHKLAKSPDDIRTHAKNGLKHFFYHIDWEKVGL